jgi:hypothetical protein
MYGIGMVGENTLLLCRLKVVEENLTVCSKGHFTLFFIKDDRGCK